MPAEHKHRNYNARLVVIYLMITLASLMLVGALGYKQLWKNEAYLQAEEKQNYRRILMPGPRGNVYDRNGNLLISNRPIFSAVVYLNELRRDFRLEYIKLIKAAREKQQITDRFTMNIEARKNVVQRYLNQMNELIGRDEVVDERRIERHFSQSLLLPFPLITDLTEAEYAVLIEHLDVDSPLQIIADNARHYPFGSAAAHVLGFVTTSSEFPDFGLPGEDLTTFRFDAKVGRAGIERSFDQHLQGRTGSEIWSVDPSGFQHERVSWQPPGKGNDLKTSLDIEMQIAGETALSGKTGAIAAIDIQTGEILVLASKPDYDLNELSPFISHVTDQRIRAEGGWLNRAIQGLYPPGSTFKLITAIAGLESGFVDGKTVIHCPGFHTVGKRVFRCHNHAGHGAENLVEAIRDSCNVFFYERGIAMGIDRIATMARVFGLHEPTGIELPGETRSMLIPDPEWKKRRFYGEGWFGGDTANTSIGQGFLLVTPLQMAAFTASLARQETRTRPTLHYISKDQDIDHGGEKIPLSPEMLDLVLEGMRESGLRGTGRLAGAPTMPVAGKTGTAQVRKDGKPTTLAWFVGYSPAIDPKVAVVVIVEGVPEQETSYGGGSTAAPIAREVFKAYHKKHPSAAMLAGPAANMP